MTESLPIAVDAQVMSHSSRHVTAPVIDKPVTGVVPAAPLAQTVRVP